jgi:hypothetical protein
MAVPDPPANIRPRLTTWSRGRAFHRIHPLRYDPTEFLRAARESVNGRFHFFERADGAIVPVLYGAENVDAAIAEVLFRNVPLRDAEKVISLRNLRDLCISVVTPKRDLVLIELFGHGLRRLGLTAEELTSTVTAEYPHTVQWAQRLHGAALDAHGLVWMSRQFNAAQALMLFGDRMKQNDLDGGEPLPLAGGEGLALVRAAANAAEIVIAP